MSSLRIKRLRQPFVLNDRCRNRIRWCQKTLRCSLRLIDVDRGKTSLGLLLGALLSVLLNSLINRNRRVIFCGFLSFFNRIFIGKVESVGPLCSNFRGRSRSMGPLVLRQIQSQVLYFYRFVQIHSLFIALSFIS